MRYKVQMAGQRSRLASAMRTSPLQFPLMCVHYLLWLAGSLTASADGISTFAMGPFALGNRNEAVCFRGSLPGGDGGVANWIVRISACPGKSDLAMVPGRYVIPGGAIGGSTKYFFPVSSSVISEAASENGSGSYTPMPMSIRAGIGRNGGLGSQERARRRRLIGGNNAHGDNQPIHRVALDAEYLETHARPSGLDLGETWR